MKVGVGKTVSLNDNDHLLPRWDASPPLVMARASTVAPGPISCQSIASPFGMEELRLVTEADLPGTSSPRAPFRER